MPELQPAIVITFGAFLGTLIGLIFLVKNAMPAKTWSIGGLMVILSIYLTHNYLNSEIISYPLTVAVVWLIPVLCYHYFKDFLNLNHSFSSSVTLAIILMIVSYGLMAVQAIPHYIVLMIASLVGIGYLVVHFITCYQIYKTTGSSKSRSCIWIWSLHVSLVIFYGFLMHSAVWMDPIQGFRLIPIYIAVLLICWTVALLLMPEYLYSLPAESTIANSNQSNLDFRSKDNTKPTARNKVKSKLSNKVKNEYLEEILFFMDFEKPYLDKNFTVYKLSQELKLSPTYTSQVVNELCGKGFKDFINGYRIKHACKSLLNGHLKSYTIEGIAQQSGFHSRAAFYNAFKKVMHMPPGAYVTKFGKNGKKTPRCIEG